MTANSGSLAIWGTGGRATGILQAVLANHGRNVVFVDQGVSPTNFTGFPVVQVDELRSGNVSYNSMFAVRNKSACQLTLQGISTFISDVSPATVIRPGRNITPSANRGPGTNGQIGTPVRQQERNGRTLHHRHTNAPRRLSHDKCSLQALALRHGEQHIRTNV